jgi:Lon protease-like protein
LQTKHCVEEGSPLGVCTLEPDPATGQIVGTAASIEVVEYDEAFRSNVELHGIRRFRLTTPK